MLVFMESCTESLKSLKMLLSNQSCSRMPNKTNNKINECCVKFSIWMTIRQLSSPWVRWAICLITVWDKAFVRSFETILAHQYRIHSNYRTCSNKCAPLILTGNRALQELSQIGPLLSEIQRFLSKTLMIFTKMTIHFFNPKPQLEC